MGERWRSTQSMWALVALAARLIHFFVNYDVDTTEVEFSTQSNPLFDNHPMQSKRQKPCF